MHLGNAGLNQIKIICVLQVLQHLHDINKHFDVHKGLYCLWCFPKLREAGIPPGECGVLQVRINPLAPIQEELLRTVGGSIRHVQFSDPSHGALCNRRASRRAKLVALWLCPTLPFPLSFLWLSPSQGEKPTPSIKNLLRPLLVQAFGKGKGSRGGRWEMPTSFTQYFFHESEGTHAISLVLVELRTINMLCEAHVLRAFCA